MTLRSRLPFLLVMLCGFAVCSAKAAPPAEAPMPPEVQHRVETLQIGYAEHVTQNALAPYEAGLKTLNAKVRPALDRAGGIAAAKKDLEALVRIKADIDRIDKGEVLTAVEAPPPEALKSLYATYRLELGKLDLARKSVVTKARQRYDKSMQDIQDALTAQQKVEAALQVKSLREKMAQMKDEELPQALQAGKQSAAPNPAVTAAPQAAPPAPISLDAAMPRKWTYHIEPEGSARGWVTVTDDGRAEFTGMHKNPASGAWERKVTPGTWTKGKKLNQLIFTFPDYSWEVQIENGIGKMVTDIGTRYLKPTP